MSFPTEGEVLLRWRDLVLETDPDIIIGYNTSNFDLPYLINRAAALKLNKFPYWGRMRNKCGPPGSPCGPYCQRDQSVDWSGQTPRHWGMGSILRPSHRPLSQKLTSVSRWTLFSDIVPVLTNEFYSLVIQLALCPVTAVSLNPAALAAAS